ncbi:hypothetical protein [Capnocytophaga canimorsus]|uniref:hypothetical protein n=1 Tax=Capnocytophaga canimorsus TaxID=28188 RepID=UPI00156261AC|nr:hypothetical protein [Capnocytophaga canimorsus]
MEVKFFGTPYTFNMYGGREDDARYFQTFDDNSKESVKLVVHRKADGKVVYSYLRYNLLTSGGRKNAWFGMAVVFQGQYCRDVLSLYKLLDLAYQQLILKKGIWLKEVNLFDVQAQFTIREFADASNDIEQIKNVIISNINAKFTDDLLPITMLPVVKQQGSKAFDNEQTNADYEEALKTSVRVVISPDYKRVAAPEPVPAAPVEFDFEDFFLNFNKIKKDVVEIVLASVEKVSKSHIERLEQYKTFIHSQWNNVKNHPRYEEVAQDIKFVNKAIDDLLKKATPLPENPILAFIVEKSDVLTSLKQRQDYGKQDADTIKIIDKEYKKIVKENRREIKDTSAKRVADFERELNEVRKKVNKATSVSVWDSILEDLTGFLSSKKALIFVGVIALGAGLYFFRPMRERDEKMSRQIVEAEKKLDSLQCFINNLNDKLAKCNKERILIGEEEETIYQGVAYEITYGDIKEGEFVIKKTDDKGKANKITISNKGYGSYTFPESGDYIVSYKKGDTIFFTKTVKVNDIKEISLNILDGGNVSEDSLQVKKKYTIQVKGNGRELDGGYLGISNGNNIKGVEYKQKVQVTIEENDVSKNNKIEFRYYVTKHRYDNREKHKTYHASVNIPVKKDKK